ncbi:hypothetical protein RchiOBHm_Chr2g0162211 [Rosa chinensis]|uniref:Transmembrane protein n=1 Tax=Rosa chinensis TaxID=74649 RepID=A0A2P6S303_ROSCH|nr:hypothetical protein RchiOBHm_Chr2g0162211 [Rosa chinensis]
MGLGQRVGFLGVVVGMVVVVVVVAGGLGLGCGGTGFGVLAVPKQQPIYGFGLRKTQSRECQSG